MSLVLELQRKKLSGHITTKREKGSSPHNISNELINVSSEIIPILTRHFHGHFVIQ